MIRCSTTIHDAYIVCEGCGELNKCRMTEVFYDHLDKGTGVCWWRLCSTCARLTMYSYEGIECTRFIRRHPVWFFLLISSAVLPFLCFLLNL